MKNNRHGFSAFWVIMCKELKRIFTDKRLVVSLFIPGILIYVMYSIMGQTIGTMYTGAATYRVCVCNGPAELAGLFADNEVSSYELIDGDAYTEQELRDMVGAEELDLLVVYPDNFMADTVAYDMASGEAAPQVQVCYNSGSTASLTVYTLYVSMMDAVEESFVNKFDVVTTDRTGEGGLMASLMAQMMPFLLLTFLYSAAMGICVEAIAGEKERGTIANLLLTPVKRTWIVVGKTAALGLTALISSLFSFAGLILSFPKLMGGEMTLDAYSFGDYLLLFLIILCTVMLFTVMLTVVSTLARTVKEAQGYATPLMFVVMLVGVLGMLDLSGVSVTPFYLIPIFNSLLCLNGILSGGMTALPMITAVAADAVYIGAGIWLLARMFSSEKVMFNS